MKRSDTATKNSVHLPFAGPAKSDFDLLVRFLPDIFFTCPYDIYIENSLKFPLVRTGCGTTWAIRTIDFAAPDLWNCLLTFSGKSRRELEVGQPTV